MRINKFCNRCDSRVKLEKTQGLRKEYKYYCPCCDENLYTFKAHNKKR